VLRSRSYASNGISTMIFVAFTAGGRAERDDMYQLRIKIENISRRNLEPSDSASAGIAASKRSVRRVPTPAGGT
jgi:hypothetical protein